MNGMMLIGIVLATAAHALIGMFWYSPQAFGPLWLKLANVIPDPVKMKNAAMIGTIAAMVMACVMANLMDRLQISSFIGAFCFGFAVWLGFVATVGLSEVIWCGKPLELYFIKMGNTLVSILTMSLILAFFI